MMNKKNKGAFTLVEIMLGILIVSIALLGGFQALMLITIGKTKIIQRTTLQKESFYFTEKLYEMIKQGGGIDYEEYFNRKVMGNNTFSSGHFLIDTGFGNFGNSGNVGSGDFGDKFYYCRSDDGDTMGGTGCITKFNSGSVDYSGEQQRFGEYSFQFIDYNSNYDDDGGIPGDEDGNGFIIGDDDDEYLGIGPSAFDTGSNLTELYLISGDNKKRIFFRWVVNTDLYGPGDCSLDGSNNITGTGCIGNIEYLKLEGKDRGLSHDLTITGSTRFDGVTDTWIIDTDFTSGIEQVAGTEAIKRVPLFPDSINVSEFKVYGYPNIDNDYNWADDSLFNIAPYVVLKLKLKPSWKSRRLIRGEGKELTFSITINLTDIYTK